MTVKNLIPVQTYIPKKTMKLLKKKMRESTSWSVSDYLRVLIMKDVN